MILHRNTHNKSGFALLLTIVIISIVLAVGISLLEITVKQISLSTTGRDSELAFNGAQAAVECAQATLKDVDVAVSVPGSLVASCFASSDPMSLSSEDSSRTSLYSFEFDWTNEGGQALCSEGDMYIMDARGGAYSKLFINQGLTNVVCANGDICTFVFARGFNRGCSDLGSLRTVQRELTISF